MKKSFHSSPRYSHFKNQRDEALERILYWYQVGFDVILDKLKNQVIVQARHDYSIGRKVPSQEMNRDFSLASIQSANLMKRMRKEIHLLTVVGEAEAMARALGKPQKFVVKKDHVHETPAGGSIDDRVELIFARLKRKVDDAFHLSRVLGSDLDEALARIERAFPPKVKRTQKRKLKRIQEADRERPPKLVTGIYDQNEWDDVVTDYQANELPDDFFRRGPDDKIIYYDIDPETGKRVRQERYEWELEQETTEDFVQQVRNGEIDTAKENGITDLVWRAIIDSKTDDCCIERDGKTTAEIEKMLDEGKLDADECDAITVPAHINCRCQLDPYTDDMPEVTPPDYGSFDDWLEEKKNE